MSARIRVLILEDRVEDAELMADQLRQFRFEPEWRRVDSEPEYEAQLAWPPDVILSDYNLPLMDSSRALDLLHQRGSSIPFIVVSGAIGEDVAVAMMRRGAADYLLKDRLSRLGPAVRRALEERTLRDEIASAGKALRASELRFYSFMDNNPALACIKDEQGRILYVNRTCETVWGLTRRECLGKTNHELWSAEIADKLRAGDLAVLQTRQASRSVEEVPLREAGSTQMLCFRFPFCEPDGSLALGSVSIDIGEQVRAQRALAAALESKEVLLRELHHRVKNNLQIISSLLAMQAASATDPKIAEPLKESQGRVQSMALVHEQLNLADKPDQLEFSEYIQSLARDLRGSFAGDSPRVRLDFMLEPVWLSLDQAIPSGLILTEILTNAFKHAFPDGREGRIRVELERAPGGMVRLRVSDDGAGMPQESEPVKPRSLGLRIVDVLARQLNGTAEYSAGANRGGTTFSLTFPIEQKFAASG